MTVSWLKIYRTHSLLVVSFCWVTSAQVSLPFSGLCQGNYMYGMTQKHILTSLQSLPGFYLARSKATLMTILPWTHDSMTISSDDFARVGQPLLAYLSVYWVWPGDRSGLAESLRGWQDKTIRLLSTWGPIKFLRYHDGLGLQPSVSALNPVPPPDWRLSLPACLVRSDIGAKISVHISKILPNLICSLYLSILFRLRAAVQAVFHICPLAHFAWTHSIS